MKLRMLPRFPALVQGVDGITVNKANGVYTIGFNAPDAPGVRIITAAGNVTVGDTDGVIAINKLVSQITTVNLGNPANRANLTLSVEDLAGVADTFPITIVASTGTIDGAASVQILNKYGFMLLRPYAGIGWKIVA